MILYLYSLYPRTSLTNSPLHSQLLTETESESEWDIVGKLLISSIEQCMTHFLNKPEWEMSWHPIRQKMSRNFETTRYAFNIENSPILIGYGRKLRQWAKRKYQGEKESKLFWCHNTCSHFVNFSTRYTVLLEFSISKFGGRLAFCNIPEYVESYVLSLAHILGRNCQC